MSNPRIASVALAAAVALAAGCASPPVHIVTPPVAGATDPVPRVVVRFDTTFNPANSWSIFLDGQIVTGFTPAAKPGGTSSAPLIYGFGPDTFHANNHELRTSASCGGFCTYATESVVFVPPQLLFNGTVERKDLTVTQFNDALASVDVQFSRSVPIVVRVEELSSPPSLKMRAPGGAFVAPGAPLFLTIPASDTKADFVINAQSGGPYVLEFTGAGVGTGRGTGLVKP